MTAFIASRKLLAGAALLASGLAVSTSARAATVVYDTPAADTYVSVAAPDTNYGTAVSLITRSPNNSSGRLAYVRFDLDSRLTTAVTDATLSFTLNGITGNAGTEATVTVYGLNYDYAPGSGEPGLDWAEGSLTNSNAPWAASGSGSVSANVTALGTFTVSVDPEAAAGTLYSITGTALAAFLETFRVNGVDDATFILRSNNSSLLYFASKESTYDPASLTVITAAAVPEPSECALLAGAAMLTLALWRRRC